MRNVCGNKSIIGLDWIGLKGFAMDDEKQLAEQRAIEDIKLENKISREGLDMLYKLYRSGMMAGGGEREAFDEARRFVAALEQGIYPSELKKRQELEEALQSIIHAGDEMYALLRLFDVEETPIIHNYKYRKETALNLLKDLEKQTKINVTVFLSKDERETYTYKIKAQPVEKE